jgi:hypothetical protein
MSGEAPESAAPRPEQPAPEPGPVPSPCIGICLLDDNGCRRTAEQIANLPPESTRQPGPPYPRGGAGD